MPIGRWIVAGHYAQRKNVIAKTAAPGLSRFAAGLALCSDMFDPSYRAVAGVRPNKVLIHGQVVATTKGYYIQYAGHNGYSCSCPAWRFQKADPRSGTRSCKHLREVLGDEFEEARTNIIKQRQLIEDILRAQQDDEQQEQLHQQHGTNPPSSSAPPSSHPNKEASAANREHQTVQSTQPASSSPVQSITTATPEPNKIDVQVTNASNASHPSAFIPSRTANVVSQTADSGGVRPTTDGHHKPSDNPVVVDSSSTAASFATTTAASGAIVEGSSGLTNVSNAQANDNADGGCVTSSLESLQQHTEQDTSMAERSSKSSPQSHGSSSHEDTGRGVSLFSPPPVDSTVSPQTTASEPQQQNALVPVVSHASLIPTVAVRTELSTVPSEQENSGTTGRMPVSSGRKRSAGTGVVPTVDWGAFLPASISLEQRRAAEAAAAQRATERWASKQAKAEARQSRLAERAARRESRLRLKVEQRVAREQRKLAVQARKAREQAGKVARREAVTQMRKQRAVLKEALKRRKSEGVAAVS